MSGFDDQLPLPLPSQKFTLSDMPELEEPEVGVVEEEAVVDLEVVQEEVVVVVLEVVQEVEDLELNTDCKSVPSTTIIITSSYEGRIYKFYTHQLLMMSSAFLTLMKKRPSNDRLSSGYRSRLHHPHIIIYNAIQFNLSSLLCPCHEKVTSLPSLAFFSTAVLAPFLFSVYVRKQTKLFVFF